ncbi:MAG: hypothetical protein V1738_03615 [Patescibacteria group bacterium]
MQEAIKMLVSDQKKPLHVQLSETGLIRLDALRQRLGFIRSGVVLTAVRVCGMAHGCNGNEPLFIRAIDGQSFEQLQVSHCNLFEPSKENLQTVTLLILPSDSSRLRQCGRLAGSLLVGAEKALAFLDAMTGDNQPTLFERRGSQYYRVLPR